MAFRCQDLPISTFKFLQNAAKHYTTKEQRCSQRLLIIAAVMALIRLGKHNEQAVERLLEEARALSAADKAARRGAGGGPSHHVNRP